MGKKYIDAEKLKRHYAWWDDEAKKIFDEIIDLQPTADVVEVVRCKDCQYRYVLNRGGSSICNLLDAQNNGEAYCSYGERKNG